MLTSIYTSWSWASLEGAIAPNWIHVPGSEQIDEEVLSTLVEVISCEVTTSDGTPYGLVESGSISLRGPLVKVKSASNQYTISGEGVKMERFCCTYDEGQPKGKLDLHCLLCRQTFGPQAPDSDPDKQKIDGLILLPVNLQKGTFRRVGVFQAMEPAYDLLMKAPIETVIVL